MTHRKAAEQNLQESIDDALERMREHEPNDVRISRVEGERNPITDEEGAVSHANDHVNPDVGSPEGLPAFEQSEETYAPGAAETAFQAMPMEHTEEETLSEIALPRPLDEQAI